MDLRDTINTISTINYLMEGFPSGSEVESACTAGETGSILG